MSEQEFETIERLREIQETVIGRLVSKASPLTIFIPFKLIAGLPLPSIHHNLQEIVNPESVIKIIITCFDVVKFKYTVEYAGVTISLNSNELSVAEIIHLIDKGLL